MNTQEIIDYLTCTALEGGSNYWYMIEDHNLHESDTKYLSELPTTENGFVLITDDCEQLDEPFRLDRKALLKGLEVMREKYSHHFVDAVNGNGDAITGDVFLQCAVFGELVYG